MKLLNSALGAILILGFGLAAAQAEPMKVEAVLTPGHLRAAGIPAHSWEDQAQNVWHGGSVTEPRRKQRGLDMHSSITI